MSTRIRRLLFAVVAGVAIVIVLAFAVPRGDDSGPRLVDDSIDGPRDDYPVVVPDSSPPPTYPDSDR